MTERGRHICGFCHTVIDDEQWRSFPFSKEAFRTHDRCADAMHAILTLTSDGCRTGALRELSHPR